MKKELIFGIGLALASTGALAQELGFNDWDADANGVINQSEWNSGLAQNDLFGTYDANDDGVLDEQEWGDIGTNLGFNEWETDNQEGISENEFGTGLWGEYDADQSGDWAENEWDDADEEGWFDV